MKKKKYITFIVDLAIILLGLINYIFPNLVGRSPVIYFYVEIFLFALLNLDEYLLLKKGKEPLYIFGAGIITILTIFLLKVLDKNTVLAVGVILYTSFLAFIKLINLNTIFKHKTHLFIARLTEVSILVLYGILISVNFYFNISMIPYMLAFWISGYGMLELFYDGIEFLSNDTKFLKE